MVKQAATGGRGGGDVPSWAMPLTLAGLAMMASRSPYPGVAIGEGGMAGIQAYLQQRREQQHQDLLAMHYGNERQRLENQAQYQTGVLGVRGRQAGAAETRANAYAGSQGSLADTRQQNADTAADRVDAFRERTAVQQQRFNQVAQGHPPANVATAQWLMDNGVPGADTPEGAFELATRSRSDPRVIPSQVARALIGADPRLARDPVALNQRVQQITQGLPGTQSPARTAAAPAGATATGMVNSADPRVQAIVQQHRSGQITREQAAAQLHALGGG
jgi:hypothetical protein